MVLSLVNALASTGESADVWLNDEGGAVVELGGVGELKRG